MTSQSRLFPPFLARLSSFLPLAISIASIVQSEAL
jgi:hypothetical protein